MNSIRRFLVVVLLITTTVVAFVAVWYGYRNSMAEAESLFDERLRDVANVLAETAEFRRSRLWGALAPMRMVGCGQSLGENAGMVGLEVHQHWVALGVATSHCNP